MRKRFSIDPIAYQKQREMDRVNFCLQAAVNLYGIIPLTDLADVVEKITGKEYSPEQLEMLPEEFDDRDDHYSIQTVTDENQEEVVCLVHPTLKNDRKKRQKLYQEQKGKPFYIPDDEQEFLACEDEEYIFPEWIDEEDYQKLSKITGVSEEKVQHDFQKNAVPYRRGSISLMDFAEKLIHAWPMHKQKNILHFSMELPDMISHVPLWINRGFCPAQLSFTEDMREESDSNIGMDIDPAVFKLEDPRSTAAVLADIGYKGILSVEAPNWLRKNDEAARPVMLEAFQDKIEQILNGENGEVEYEIILPMFYLAEMHETQIFKPLVKLAGTRGHKASVVWMFMHVFLDRLFYLTFDGDLETAAGYLNNFDVSVHDKTAMLDTVCQKYSDGELTEEELTSFFEPLLTEEMASGHATLFSELIQYISMLGFRPVYDKARSLLEKYPDVFGQTSPADLDKAMKHPHKNVCFMTDENGREQKDLFMEDAGFLIAELLTLSMNMDDGAGGFGGYGFDLPGEKTDQENKRQRVRNKKSKTKNTRKSAKKARKANRKK